MTERAAVLDLKKYRVPTSTVVIIDDQSTGRMVLTEIMRVVDPRIKVIPFSNPAEAIEYVNRTPVDMVVTDYMMPRMDGVQTTRELRSRFCANELPIVMTTIVHSRELMYRAFEAGISEYLLRPVDPIECRLRFEHLLARQRNYTQQSRQIDVLKQQLQSGAGDGSAEEQWLQRLTAYNTQYDIGSGRSQQNVAMYASLIGRTLGCGDADLELLGTASSVHDIGELALPAALWAETGVFSEAQQDQARQHANIGHDLLAAGVSPLMQCAAEIARDHHERRDGSGYPRGLLGHEVSDFSRIVAVADVFNALVSDRPWRAAMCGADAVDYLCGDLRNQFDTEVLDALQASVDALERPVPGRVNRQTGAGPRHA